MSFWDSNVWSFIIQMSIILVLILLANTIRRKVSFIRNSLLPASVIAGVIIFILKFIPFVSNWVDETFMESEITPKRGTASKGKEASNG